MLTIRPAPDADPADVLRRAVRERCPVTLDPEQCRRLLAEVDGCRWMDLLVCGRGVPDDTPGVLPGREG